MSNAVATALVATGMSIYHCRRCRQSFRFEGDRMRSCPNNCRYVMSGEAIRARVTNKKCSAICQNAKRGDCECSCAGENHGLGH